MKYVFPEYKENVVLGNGKLQLNPMSYQVIYEGKEIDLTPREFEVLYLLALKPNWVMPKTNIYHCIRKATNSICIISGQYDENSIEIAKQYQKHVPAIECMCIKDTKHLPQIEQPEEFAEQLDILFSAE